MYRFIITIAFIFFTPHFIHAQSINQEDEFGLKQGRWIRTYQNGKTRYEGQFRNDKPYGDFAYYYESGKLKAVSKYSDDGAICKVNSFFENGNPMAEGTYVNQKKDGVWIFYSDIDGKKVAQENYKMGELEGRKISFYPETGETAELIFYKDGIKNGLFQKYFEGGQIMVVGKYIDDKLDGEYTVYYESGKVKIHGFYNKGIQTGNWEYYDENGNPVSEDIYFKQSESSENTPE